MPESNIDGIDLAPIEKAVQQEIGRPLRRATDIENTMKRFRVRAGEVRRKVQRDEELKQESMW